MTEEQIAAALRMILRNQEAMMVGLMSIMPAGRNQISARITDTREWIAWADDQARKKAQGK